MEGQIKKEEQYNPEEEIEVGNWKIIDLKRQDDEAKENATNLF